VRSFEEIRALAIDLQRRRSNVLKYMMEIKRHYEADWVVPLPDVKGEPDQAQFIPSLITDTVDGLGMRAASISPTTFCPSLSLHQTAQDRAMTRRKVIHGTYHRNHWKVKRRRYYRHLTAYDTAGVFIEPDFKNEGVLMNVRDPLYTYPEPMSAELVRPPEYVAFITRHSGAALRKKFPKVAEENGGPIAAQDAQEEWDILEWVDTEQTVFGLLGPKQIEGKHIATGWTSDGDLGAGPWMPLTQPVRNLTGMCPAIIPQEISLHSVGTRLNALLGNVEMQTRLMALEVMAQQKAIFPDMFVIGAEHQQPVILNGGKWQDGRSGDMNLLAGVQQVGQISQTPDVRTQAMIDRLERNTRVSSGLNPQMGGESFGSLRTGRALDAMMSSSVDPRIQELHEVTETWMPHINEVILATWKEWFGPKQISMYSGWKGDKGLVKFTPQNDIDTYENTVEYSVPGADTIQQTQVLGSMLGAEAISLDTFRTQHPWIDDAEAEKDSVTQEQLFKAMVAAIQEQIASGQMPIAIVAKLYEKVREGTALPEALVEIDEEIKAEQAAAAEAAQQEAMADPMAQMGLAAGPGAAAPAALPPEMMQGGPPPLQPGSPQMDMEAMLASALGAQ